MKKLLIKVLALAMLVTCAPLDVIALTGSAAVESIEVAKGTETTITLNGDYSEEVINGLDTNIATVDLISTEVNEAQTGTDTSYNGDMISLDECLMKFTKATGDNEYTVSHDYNGTTLYLGTRSSSNNSIPVTANQTTVNVEAQGNNRFAFADTAASGGGKYLYFHLDSLKFNRNSIVSNNNTSFYVLERTTETSDDQIIYGWNIVTEFVDGNSYLIATVADNGNTYVLRPNTDSNIYSYVARALAKDDIYASTQYSVTGVEAGSTMVNIGNVTYFIDVTAENTYTIGVGETVDLYNEVNYGENTVIQDSTIINVETTAKPVGAPYNRILTAEVASGDYLIGNTSHVGLQEIIKDGRWAQSGIKLQTCDYTSTHHEDKLWTITKVDGGYTIQSTDGKYVTFKNATDGGCTISLEDTQQIVQIARLGETGYNISYELNGTTYYFNNYGGANALLAGWNGNTAEWGIYEPATYKTTITGLKAGTTTCTVGESEYTIIVKDTADYTHIDNLTALLQSLDLNNYTYESAMAVENAFNAIVRNLPYPQQDEVDTMAENLALAINNLVEIDETAAVDKSLLSKFVDFMTYSPVSNYIEYSEAKEAFENAKLVLANESATQKEVNTALKELTTAFDSLVKGTEEIPTSEIQVTAGSEEPDNATEGNPDYVLDNNPSTMWHTNYDGSTRDEQWLEFTFDEITDINEIKILQRQGTGTNGLINTFDLYVKRSETDEWTKHVSDATLTTSRDWQSITFDTVTAKQVKLQVKDAQSVTTLMYAAAAEVRFVRNIYFENTSLNKDIQAFWTKTDEPCPVNSGHPLAHAVDGIKNNYMNHCDFGQDNNTDPQYVQVDLGSDTYIDSINLYRYWVDNRVYKNTVIALSDDPYFMNPTIVYNTDSENVQRLGVGEDETYQETASGHTFSNIDITARYVRIYMNGVVGGATTSHICELEVMGASATPTQVTEDVVYMEKGNTQTGDYLFEGYYSDEQGTSKITREAFFADGGYAKYVTPEVLTVKAQVSEVADSKFNARFFTSVASLDPDTVKFKIERTINGVTSSKETESHIVYETINSDFGETVNSASEVFANSASAYFSAVKLNNIPTSFTGTITVTPYWLPYGEKATYAEGEQKYIQGTPRTFTISGDTLVEVSE